MSCSNILFLLSNWPFYFLHCSHSLLGSKDDIPCSEVIVDNPVREALATDPNALKHTVAGKLVHNKEGVDHSGLLVVVGHNATDEGGLSCHQHVDQAVQLVPKVGADSLEAGHLGSSL